MKAFLNNYFASVSDYSEHRETLMGLVENGSAKFEETVEWDNLKVKLEILYYHQSRRKRLKLLNLVNLSIKRVSNGSHCPLSFQVR